MADVVTTRNFEKLFPGHQRDAFWRTVERTVGEVFQKPTGVVENFRNRLDEAPVGEQMLVYGEEPLKVAADLVDGDLEHFSDEQWQHYRRVVGAATPGVDAVPD